MSAELFSVFSHEHFMKEAYKQALYAKNEGEIPVGAVVVCRNKIIARAYNQTEKLQDVTAHAEMLAITAAANYLGSKYLQECILYVTLEPCVMCAGGLFWAQLQGVIYGAPDPKRGYRRVQPNLLHPKTEMISGVMAQDCSELVTSFFREMRG